MRTRYPPRRPRAASSRPTACHSVHVFPLIRMFERPGGRYTRQRRCSSAGNRSRPGRRRTLTLGCGVELRADEVARRSATPDVAAAEPVAPVQPLAGSPRTRRPPPHSRGARTRDLIGDHRQQAMPPFGAAAARRSAGLQHPSTSVARAGPLWRIDQCVGHQPYAARASTFTARRSVIAQPSVVSATVQELLRSRREPASSKRPCPGPSRGRQRWQARRASSAPVPHPDAPACWISQSSSGRFGPPPNRDCWSKAHAGRGLPSRPIRITSSPGADTPRSARDCLRQARQWVR